MRLELDISWGREKTRVLKNSISYLVIWLANDYLRKRVSRKVLDIVGRHNIFFFFSFLNCWMAGTLLAPPTLVMVSVYSGWVNTTWWDMSLLGVRVEALKKKHETILGHGLLTFLCTELQYIIMESGQLLKTWFGQ